MIFFKRGSARGIALGSNFYFDFRGPKQVTSLQVGSVWRMNYYFHLLTHQSDDNRVDMSYVGFTSF